MRVLCGLWELCGNCAGDIFLGTFCAESRGPASVRSPRALVWRLNRWRKSRDSGRLGGSSWASPGDRRRLNVNGWLRCPRWAGHGAGLGEPGCLGWPKEKGLFFHRARGCRRAGAGYSPRNEPGGHRIDVRFCPRLFLELFRAGKLALETENGRAQGSRMKTDKEQFSGNRDSVKGSFFHLLQTEHNLIKIGRQQKTAS